MPLSSLDRGVIAATDSDTAVARGTDGLVLAPTAAGGTTGREEGGGIRLGFSSGTVAPGRAALNARSYLALRVAPPPPWRARGKRLLF